MSKMTETRPEPLPRLGLMPEFVIGITGHRDISEKDIDKLRADLREAFSSVAQQLPNIPVRVVSGLASGADTIALEVALELGLEVRAVLPMPLASYRQDFEGEALGTLETLLNNPRLEVTEIPMFPANDTSQNRDAQYSLLADYLARRSNLLIAIWDGEINGLPGGTSDVVMRYLGDIRTSHLKEITHDGGNAEGCGNVVMWVPVRRQSDESTTPHPASTYMVSNANYDCYWTCGAIPDAVLTRWRGFDEYCVERNSSLGADLPAYGLAQNDDESVSPELESLDTEFVRSDQIARYFQSRSHIMFALFGLLAAGMGLAFLVYAKLYADKNLLVVYIALFVAGFLGFRYTRKLHLHSKHLAYRALAETFRVQYFLMLSGAGEDYNPRRILSLTSVDQFRRFEWLQEAIRIGEPVVYYGHADPEKILAKVNADWISDQLKYFEKKRHALHSQHHRLETIKLALLVGSVVGALALIFFKKALLHLDMMGYDGKAWLVFFMGLLPLWAAVWELYQGKMATRELLWQYANQTRYFRAAHHEIGQTDNLQDGQKIIRDLADKALVEIYIWSVHRFHREHEPPAAG